MLLSHLTEYPRQVLKLSAGDILKLRDATSRIQRITADFTTHRIKESAAIELVQLIIEYLEPILRMYNKPLMLWPPPIHELLQAIHESGFKTSFVENMFLQQELTVKLGVKQPKITNVEIVDAINETRSATIAAAKENILQKCMDRLKINLDQAKWRLVCQDHLDEPDGNIFFVIWDNETSRAVSKRMYYKELLNVK